MPRMTVVIPTWNAVELLAHTLGSLERQTCRDFEVIVVDNGSSDGTRERLREDHPAIRVVGFDTNRGFAAAVNAGILAARGEIVVLMNNDTEAEPGWLSALARAMDDHPEVGSCASKVLMFHDRTRIDSAGDQLGIFASQIGHGEPDGAAFAQSRYVISPCAAAAAYRRSLFDDVGLFDERFFAYFEDVDLGLRAQFAGHKCLYVPEAVIYHHGSATAKRMAETKFFLHMRNLLIVFFQYMPIGRMLVWAPVALAWPLACAVIERQSPRVALRAIAGFLREVPGVVRRRRELNRTRRISWRTFGSYLAGPLVRQRRTRRVWDLLLRRPAYS